MRAKEEDALISQKRRAELLMKIDILVVVAAFTKKKKEID